jgi:hypothetical protein
MGFTKVLDLIGNKYGDFVVTNRIKGSKNKPAKQELTCLVCGNVRTPTTNNLKRYKWKHEEICNNWYLEDYDRNLIGKSFGYLDVMYRTRITPTGVPYYMCRCKCGNTKEVRGVHIKRGKTLSCGCYRKSLLTKHGLYKTPEYRRWYVNKRRERHIKYDSYWTPQMAIMLKESQSSCVVCKSQDRLEIDHVNPLSEGYGLYPGNAIILCRLCNRTKKVSRLDDLPPDWSDKIIDAMLDFKILWQSRHSIKLETETI